METLLNWLWQGCALTALASVILWLSHGLSATTRYQVWWITLLLVLTLPALPLMPAVIMPAEVEASIAPGAFQGVTFPPLPPWALSVFVTAWFVWIAVMFARAVNGLARVRRLKQACVPFPVDREARLRHWMSIRMLGRRVRLAVSDEIGYAAAIGPVSPVIAVAPLVLQELEDEELDQILVHEWAHIERRDDIARLFQALVGMLAGFSPAVWWIAQQLEIEREVACDDQVIEMTGARMAYAACLTKLAAVPCTPPGLALVSGALSTSQLTIRIHRLLDGRRNVSNRRSCVALALTSPGLLVLAVAVASTKPVILATPGLQPLPMPSETWSPSALSLEERGAPVDDALLAALSPRPSPTPRQPVRRSTETRASAGTGARTSTTRMEDPLTVQPVPTTLTESVQDFEGNAGHVLPPIAADVTRSTLVSLSHHLESLPAPGAQVSPGTAGTDVSPWAAAATAGMAVGRTSQHAATRMAGFFNKLSKNIAGTF